MKVTNEIGLFTRLNQSFAKQRTDGKAGTQSVPKSVSSSMSPIKDKIDISSFKSSSDVQSLTSEMTKKKFTSIKEYGAYFLSAYNKIKTDRSS